MDTVLLWLKQFAPCFFLVGLSWLTYWDSLQNQWVSDDIDPGGGIAIHDGLIHVKGWPGTCKECKEGKCYKTAPFSYGILFKQLRWNYGKAPNSGYNLPFNRQDPNSPKDSRQWIAHSVRHHRFNLILFSGVLVALYSFLSAVLGEKLAFYSCLLFAVHPLGCQTVVWVSGIGYIVSFFFCLLGLNFATLFPSGNLLHLGIYALLQLISVETIFATCGVPLIFALLGMWPYAVISGLIALYTCFRTFKESVALRIKVFKEQQMGYSATFHLRKPIVMYKTLAYYTKLMFFPKRMGLYHKFGYHYEMPQIELEDKYFWAGVFLTGIYIASMFLAPFPIRFSITFTFAFLVLFLNWIVIHQFVSERYAWIPSVGVCTLTAFLLQNHLYIFWILFGIALMRTWVHIPTYKNEMNFYESNIWNYPDSEVAMGNMGVVALKHGFPGMAIDYWMKGVNTNPTYDVNWYNLYSITKGQIAQQYINLCNPLNYRQFLINAIQSKTCHFPKQWREELSQLDQELLYMQKFQQVQLFANSIRQDSSKQEIVGDLDKAMTEVNQINRLLEAEKAKQSQDLVMKLEEINRSVFQLDAKKRLIEEEKKKLENLTDVNNIKEKQHLAIDAMLSKISQMTGTPIVIQIPTPLEQPTPQIQKVEDKPKVISIGASPNAITHHPVSEQGGQKPPGTP